MFYGDYPEYPTTALIFYFDRDQYLKPDEHRKFFNLASKRLGKHTYLRSFTLFESAFHEVSFWIDESKIGSLFQKILNKIYGEPRWMLVDSVAKDLANEISEKLDLNIRARVIEVNKNSNNKEAKQ